MSLSGRSLSGAAPYRGEDRRGGPRPSFDVPRRSLAIAALLLAATWIIVFRPLGFPEGSRVLNIPLLDALLETSAAAFAVSIALLGLVRWRLIGDALALRAGIALLLYGGVTITLGTLVPLVVPGIATTMAWVRLGGLTSVLWLMASSVRAPRIDAGIRPARFVRTGLLTAGIAGAGGAGITAVVAPITIDPSALAPWVAMAFVPLIAGLLARAERERHTAAVWLALALAAVTVAELVPLVGGSGMVLGASGPAALRVLGLGFAFAAAKTELEQAYAQQRSQLLHSLVDVQTAQAWERAQQEASERRAHDAFNALTAIDGVTRTIERYRDRIDPATRDELSESVRREMLRLQQLIAPGALADLARTYPIEEALRSSLAEARAAGIQVSVDSVADMVAFGQPEAVGQIVGLLLDIVAGSSPSLHVEISDAEDQTVLRFIPTGGSPPDLTHDGSGLGMFVASRLASGQGGAVWMLPEADVPVIALAVPKRP